MFKDVNILSIKSRPKALKWNMRSRLVQKNSYLLYTHTKKQSYSATRSSVNLNLLFTFFHCEATSVCYLYINAYILTHPVLNFHNWLMPIKRILFFKNKESIKKIRNSTGFLNPNESQKSPPAKETKISSIYFINSISCNGGITFIIFCQSSLRLFGKSFNSVVVLTILSISALNWG